MTELPSSVMSRMNWKMSCFAAMSTPLVGSSRRNRLGLNPFHFAMETFCWFPPLSEWIKALGSFGEMPKESIATVALSNSVNFRRHPDWCKLVWLIISSERNTPCFLLSSGTRAIFALIASRGVLIVTFDRLSLLDKYYEHQIKFQQVLFFHFQWIRISQQFLLFVL